MRKLGREIRKCSDCSYWAGEYLPPSKSPSQGDNVAYCMMCHEDKHWGDPACDDFQDRDYDPNVCPRCGGHVGYVLEYTDEEVYDGASNPMRCKECGLVTFEGHDSWGG